MPFEEKVEKYRQWLRDEAETSCNYYHNLRLAGAVDALETLGLISDLLANNIRDLLSVS